MVKFTERLYPQVWRGQTCLPSFVDDPALLLAAMLRIERPSDGKARYEISSMRRFAGSPLDNGLIFDETTSLNFRHLLEANGLNEQMLALINQYLSSKGLCLSKGTTMEATVIKAPSLTKNITGTLDSELHQTTKGSNWHFEMKAHIEVDAKSGLVHSLAATSANVQDLTNVEKLLTGEGSATFADAGCRGAGPCLENW